MSNVSSPPLAHPPRAPGVPKIRYKSFLVLTKQDLSTFKVLVEKSGLSASEYTRKRLLSEVPDA